MTIYEREGENLKTAEYVCTDAAELLEMRWKELKKDWT